MKSKIYNYIHKDDSGRIINSIVFCDSVFDGLKTYASIFLGFNYNKIINIIEIPNNKWHSLVSINKSSAAFKVRYILKQQAEIENSNVLYDIELSFTDDYINYLRYEFKQSNLQRLKPCPVVGSEGYLIGSTACNHTCCKLRKYSYDEQYLICDDLNKILCEEELKLYQVKE